MAHHGNEAERKKAMKDGFVKVAAVTPDIKVGDIEYNTKNIISGIRSAAKGGAKIAVLPELCITAYTCGDLFLQEKLINDAKAAVLTIADETRECDILSAVGMPLCVEDKLYNVAAIISDGKVLGFVPKMNLPNYSEFYELRHFNIPGGAMGVEIGGERVLMSAKQIFCARGYEPLKIACEICEDLWITAPPSISHVQNGASVIMNLSASDEIIGKADFRRMLLRSQSARCLCAYIYSDAGEGESTTDMVFAGHGLIYENGAMLAESNLFENTIAFADIDLNKISLERRRINTFKSCNDSDYKKIYFDIKIEENDLKNREFNAHPFVPPKKDELQSRCEEIFNIQYHGLKKRLMHIGAKTVTIGISGGLDSTLALLVAVKAFDSLGLDRSGIIGVTMPCFGTTDRTYQNAVKLIKQTGASFREVNIKEAVTVHLNDMGAPIDEHDAAFENAQARERTQVLMDIANKSGGIVVGTGDLSELALGWATYNGDHMSMYAVNASIPKTLVRYMVEYAAQNTEKEMSETLKDILDTPVSPELLPPDDGEITQKTEDIVGPYELHDFFLYNMVRYGFSKHKIERMCKAAFADKYSKDEIKKWLDIFYRRFYANQFKRSCMPDGPKVGSVALSPRGDWRMPSDAVE